MKLTAMLHSAVTRHPDRVALKEAGAQNAAGREWTYTQLRDDVGRTAQLLLDAGIGPGDVVAAMTFNEPEYVLTAYAAWQLGAVFVPVNHKMPAREVKYIVDHSEAKVGVVSPDLAATAREGGPGVKWITTAHAGGSHNGEEPVGDGLAARIHGLGVHVETHTDDSAPALILYTSGTTSAPKGCLHIHSRLVTLMLLMSTNQGYDRDERILVSMPVWHSAPLNVCITPVIFMAGTVVLQREYDPIETFQLIGQEQITAFFGPNIAFLAPLRALPAAGLDFDAFDFSTMRHWMFGGSPIDKPTTEAILEHYQPGEHRQLYGMSELGPAGSLLWPEEQLAKAGSVGRAAMYGGDMKLVKADGAQAGPGGTGEIWIKVDTAMIEYLKNPAATAEAFDGGWYKSGDVARMDDDGYYFVVDRLKDIVIVGGENVYTLEVDEAVSGHPRVADVAVVGKPDPEWGQQLVAVVTTTDGGGLSVDELREYLADKLARYKIPRFVEVVDLLPRNPSGKLLKHRLRDLVSDPDAGGAAGSGEGARQ